MNKEKFIKERFKEHNQDREILTDFKTISGALEDYANEKIKQERLFIKNEIPNEQNIKDAADGCSYDGFGKLIGFVDGATWMSYRIKERL